MLKASFDQKKREIDNGFGTGGTGCIFAREAALSNAIAYEPVFLDDAEACIAKALRNFVSTQHHRVLTLLPDCDNPSNFEKSDELAWSMYGHMLQAMRSLAGANQVQQYSRARFASALCDDSIRRFDIENNLATPGYRDYICNHTFVDEVFHMTPAIVDPCTQKEETFLALAVGPEYPSAGSDRSAAHPAVCLMYRSDVTKALRERKTAVRLSRERATHKAGFEYQRGFHISHPPLPQDSSAELLGSVSKLIIFQ